LTATTIVGAAGLSEASPRQRAAGSSLQHGPPGPQGPPGHGGSPGHVGTPGHGSAPGQDGIQGHGGSAGRVGPPVQGGTTGHDGHGDPGPQGPPWHGGTKLDQGTNASTSVSDPKTYGSQSRVPGTYPHGNATGLIYAITGIVIARTE